MYSNYEPMKVVQRLFEAERNKLFLNFEISSIFAIMMSYCIKKAPLPIL